MTDIDREGTYWLCEFLPKVTVWTPSSPRMGCLSDEGMNRALALEISNCGSEFSCPKLGVQR